MSSLIRALGIQTQGLTLVCQCSTHRTISWALVVYFCRIWTCACDSSLIPYLYSDMTSYGKNLKEKANTLRMLQTHKYLTDKGRKVKLSHEKHVLDYKQFGESWGMFYSRGRTFKGGYCLSCGLAAEGHRASALRCVNDGLLDTDW